MGSPEFVRVRVKDNGAITTISRAEYDAFDGYELLEGQDAVDVRGNPLPDKPKTTVDEAAAAKKTASRPRAAKKTSASSSAAATTNPNPAGDSASLES